MLPSWAVASVRVRKVALGPAVVLVDRLPLSMSACTSSICACRLVFLPVRSAISVSLLAITESLVVIVTLFASTVLCLVLIWSVRLLISVVSVAYSGSLVV